MTTSAKRWPMSTLADLGARVTSGSRGWAALYSDHGDLFVRITNLTRERIRPDLTNCRFVNVDPSNAEAIRTRLAPGDLLVSITADIGIIGYVDETMPTPAYINQHIARVRLDPRKADSRFVAYYLSSWVPQRAFVGATDQGAKAGMNLTAVANLVTAAPPVDEQARIAEALSDADEAIRSLEQLIDKKQAIKQGMMQQLLTGRTRLPGFSGEWTSVPLAEVADRRDRYSLVGGPFGSSLTSDEYTTIGVRILQLQNIGDGEFRDDYAIFTSEHKANALRSSNIYPGDLLIAKMGDPVARACPVPQGQRRYQMASDGIRLAVDRSCFDSRLVMELINASEFRASAEAVSTGSTRMRISLAQLRRLQISLPLELPEQVAIADALTSADHQLACFRDRLSKAYAIKTGMMQQLLTGRTRLPVEAES